MGRYRISESVQGSHVNSIHDYDDLGIHHPTANALGMKTGRPEDFQRGRPHRKVEGHFEEVRLLGDGRTLVKKDFILSHDSSGPVRIPAPVSGFIHYRNDRYATVDIFDKPSNQPEAKLLAQILHMDARSFDLKEGEAVAYGQPLGVMAHTGLPNGVHAHVELEPDQFRRYIDDIDRGVITPNSYPGLLPTFLGDAERPNVLNSGSERRPGMKGKGHAEIDSLQRELSQLGYKGRNGHPLAIDAALGPNTIHAIKSFQHAHHLHVDGIAGPRTLAALEDARRHPLLSEATNPHHPLYGQLLNGIHALPHDVQPRGRELENVAVALTLSAAAGGLRNVDHVVLGRDGVNLFAVQGRLDDPSHRLACVEMARVAAHGMDHRATMPQPIAVDHLQAAISPNVAQRAQAMAGP